MSLFLFPETSSPNPKKANPPAEAPATLYLELFNPETPVLAPASLIADT